LLTYKTLQDTYDKITKAIVDLRQETEQGALVLVEGPRDQASLHKLGVDKGVIQLRAYREILDRDPEEFADRKIVVLTDFDREGEFLNKRISRHLSQIGVEHDLSYRRKLKCLVKNGVREVEDIHPYFAKRFRR